MSPRTETLSEFLEAAESNTRATVASEAAFIARLRGVSAAFALAIESLHNTPHYVPGFFLLRAHSAFLGACRLALSGQVPETYMVLRGSLEAALYGLYFFRNPGQFASWMERHDSDAQRKTVRRTFTTAALMQELLAANVALHQRASELYEATIDLGAHPNVRSVAGHLSVTETEDHIGFDLRYLTTEPVERKATLKDCCLVGITVLEVFRIVFKERFDIVGLTDTTGKLKRGL